MSEIFANIDPSVIESLGLDEGALRENFLKAKFAKGENDYQSYRNSGLSKYVEIALPGVNRVHTAEIGRDFSKVPYILLQKWQAIRENQFGENSALAQLAEAGLIKYLEGLAIAAIDHPDFKTATAAFDLITKGGILQNEAAMLKLKQSAESATNNGHVDYVLSLAQIMQETINRHPAVTFASWTS